MIGVELSTHTVQLYGGGTRQKPDIWFSGFCSQGDGACFEGSYRYKPGAAKAIREYAPKDTALHRIADELQAAQGPAFYGLTASMSHTGRYYHSGCMAVSVERQDRDGWNIGATDDQESAVTDAMRDLADWLYSALEREYNWLMSDESVDDNIRANEYEFTESGEIYY